MDLGDAVFEACALDLVCELAIPKRSFERDELPFLESPGELREIFPGVDAVPFGAGLVLALVVLPAFLGGKVEDDVLAVFLGSLGLCLLALAGHPSSGTAQTLRRHRELPPVRCFCMRLRRTSKRSEMEMLPRCEYAASAEHALWKESLTVEGGEVKNAQQLFDLPSCGDYCVAINDLSDLFTFMHHNEVEVEGIWTGRGVQNTNTGAIGVDGVSSGTGCPLLCRWDAVCHDVIDLRDVASAIVTLKDDASKRNLDALKDDALDRQPVLARERPIRAACLP